MRCALLCTIDLDKLDLFATLRAEHYRYLIAHRDSIVFGGPARVAEGGRPETMIIVVEAPSLSAAERFIAEEPYNSHGGFSHVAVRPWSQVIPETEPGALERTLQAESDRDKANVPPADSERNKRLVVEHFDDFVNRRDLGAIERNMAPGFLDHDGPGGKPTDRAGDRAMMAAMHALFPDLRVEVRDAVAEGDKVVVRNVWAGTNAQTGQGVEFHGFVLWRVEGGKIAERWATVTPLHELAAQSLDW